MAHALDITKDALAVQRAEVAQSNVAQPLVQMDAEYVVVVFGRAGSKFSSNMWKVDFFDELGDGHRRFR